MVKHSNRKCSCRAITLDELVELCKRINGTLSEARAIGEEYGVGKEYIIRLRTLLGYTVDNAYKLAAEQREEIAQDYKLNHGSITHYAEKYGVSFSDIVSLLKSRRIYEGDKRKWTKIECMKIRLLYERKTPHKEIAMQLHKTIQQVRGYIYREITKTKKHYNGKKDAA